jgi:hypothetical protein
MWELCNFKITRPELRTMLGEPHVVETDGTRTYGGEEDGWGYVLARAIVSLSSFVCRMASLCLPRTRHCLTRYCVRSRLRLMTLG